MGGHWLKGFENLVPNHFSSFYNFGKRISIICEIKKWLCEIHQSFFVESSNINEGIRVVLFFLQKDLTHTKSTKSTKRKQATFTQTFFTHMKSIKSIKKTKSTKSTKRQTSDFLFLRCFYAHKNAAFFVLHTKKHKKHIKSIKTQISE